MAHSQTSALASASIRLIRPVGLAMVLLGLVVLGVGLFLGLSGMPVTENFHQRDATHVGGSLHRVQLKNGSIWDNDPFWIVDDSRLGPFGSMTRLTIGGREVVESRVSTSDLRKPGASGFLHAGVINIYFAAPEATPPNTIIQVSYKARLVSPMLVALLICAGGIFVFGFCLVFGPETNWGLWTRKMTAVGFALLATISIWLWTTGAQVRQTIELDRVNQHVGVSYVYKVRPPWPLNVPQVDRANSVITARVQEDGVALGPADALSDAIRDLGNGRHVMANDRQLRFTASDNSDPRTNGRHYQVDLLCFLSQWAALAILLSLILMFLADLTARRGVARSSLRPAAPAVAIALPSAMAVMVLGYLGWLAWVDALHIFSPPSDDDYFVRDEPARMAGLVRTYPFEGIIIGSSMSQNFYMSEASAALGIPILNATVAGSFPRDQFFIARLALKTRHPKLVVWDYHLTGWNQDPESMRRQVFPFGLYDDNPLFLLDYAFSLQAWLDAKAALKARRGFGNMPLDEVNKWGNRLPFGRELVGKRYCPRLANPPGPINEVNIRANLNVHMKPLIEAYPKTQFVYFVPPYSGAMHSRKGGIMTDTVSAARLMYEEIGHYPNVRIFDFQAIDDFTADPDVYRDAVHYNVEIHSRMLKWIAEGRREITGDNIDRHEAELAPKLEDVARRMDEAMVPVCRTLEAER